MITDSVHRLFSRRFPWASLRCPGYANVARPSFPHSHHSPNPQFNHKCDRINMRRCAGRVIFALAIKVRGKSFTKLPAPPAATRFLVQPWYFDK